MRPRIDDHGMDETIISLLAPVSRERIERWVEGQVDRLRTEASSTGVRLGPLSSGGPGQGGDWLVEVDLRDRDVPLEDDVALGSVLTEMALLGLRPQLSVRTIDDQPAIRDPHAPAAELSAPRGNA